MPTSDHLNIAPILSVLTKMQPKSILDVGCGFGKYGSLLREYLDVWNDRLAPATWQTEIVGIEAFPAYKNPIHDFVYSRVHYGDALEVLPSLNQRFDACLIIDMIEHLDIATARKFIAEALRRSRLVVVSTPKKFYAQGAHFGNAHEAHLSLVTQHDFPSGCIVRCPNSFSSCNVYFASREPLPDHLFHHLDPTGQIYAMSRNKLGLPGLPLSIALRWLCRVLS